MADSKRSILVIGATGNQGCAVVRHLLKRENFAVRALVRDKNNHTALTLQQAGAELVAGDLNDPASLDRALQGVYGVFSVQSLEDGLDTEIQQGKAVADAAKAAGVEHFVYSSVGSAERKTGVPHFDSKFQIEEHIRSIDLPYTILRPVFFFYNYESMRDTIENGTLPQPLSPETKLQQLSEEDYGEMVADVFDRPTDFGNQALEVASVEMTMTEVVATFGRVLGINVEYQQISFEEFEQQAGAEMTSMYRWFEHDGYKADFDRSNREFAKLTDLESYLHNVGWAMPIESAATV